MFGSNLQLLSYKPMRRFHSLNHCAPSFFAGKFHESSTSIVWGAEIMVWNFMNTKVLDIVYTVSSIVSSLFRVRFEALWYCFSLWSVSIWKANCFAQGLTARPPYLKANQRETSPKKNGRLIVLGIEAPLLTRLSYSGRSSICAS